MSSGRMLLTDLLAYPLVTLPEGTGIRAALDEACVTRSLTPDVALAASAPGTVVELASRGMGVAVLSESMADAFPHLQAVPIADVEIPALLALVWRPRTSPALAALLPRLLGAFAVDNPAEAATSPVENRTTVPARLDSFSA